VFTEVDLQELLKYQAKFPVVSVFLNTDPARGNADTHKLHLRTLLKDLETHEDIETITRYFDHTHQWSGRSVVIFSCAPEGYFKAFSMAVPIRSRIRVSDRPFVKPLADLLDSYGGYGVVLVDKQDARLFYFHLGQLQEQQGMEGEEVRRTKRGGGSQAPGRRGGSTGQTDYIEEVTDRNAKEMVELSTRFFSENNVRRILIGGTDDNVAFFRNQLPKAWQSLVVGSFPISKVANKTEILAKAMQIGKEVEQRRESQLARSVVTGAAKGRGGVINLEETLNAIHEGRVQTLLIRDGFRAPGYQCTKCNYLSSLPMEVCPFCGGKTKEIPDAVELAVRKIMQTGGEVEVLQGDHVIEGFEQIGGLLRY
jgi:peptide subunit release factor 1 (eRF1)